MDEMAERLLLMLARATLEYDLTCPAPPTQVQEVLQTKERALPTEVKVVH